MMGRRTLTAFLMVILMTLGMGCSSTPRDERKESMPTASALLIGDWTKDTGLTCAQAYPDVLQLQESGLYFGRMNSPGMFTLWDVGTYVVIDHRTIDISTANDAVVRYSYLVRDGNQLTFQDPDGCEFDYRKSRE